MEHDRVPRRQIGRRMDWDDFAKWGGQISGWAAEYHRTLRDRPVRAQARPGDTARLLDAAPPAKDRRWTPSLRISSASSCRASPIGSTRASSRYFPANATPPSMLAEYPRHHDRAAMHALAEISRGDRDGRRNGRLASTGARPAGRLCRRHPGQRLFGDALGGADDRASGPSATPEIVTDCPARAVSGSTAPTKFTARSTARPGWRGSGRRTSPSCQRAARVTPLTSTP